MTIITAIFGIGIIFLIGNSILRIIYKFEYSFLFLSFAYGVGFIAVSLQLIIYSIVSIDWNFFSIIFPWIGIFLLSYRNFFYSLKTSNKSYYRISFSYVILFILCFYVVIQSILFPLSSWDGYAAWFLGGKAFYLNKSFIIDYFLYSQTSYPPLIYFFISYMYVIFGEVNDQYALIIHSGFYCALVICFYTFLRYYSSHFFSLCYTFIFASTHNVIRHGGRYDVGDTDLILSYFIFSTVMIGLLYLKQKTNSLLYIFILFLSATVLIKSEGIVFYFLMLFVFGIAVKDKKKLFLFFFPLLTIGIWEIIRLQNALPNNPFFTMNIHFERLWIVLIEMGKEFITIQRWNLIWILFFVTIPFFRKINESVIFLPVIFGHISVYYFIYLMTPINPISHIQNSFDRLLLHVIPLALFYSGRVIYILLLEKRRSLFL